LERPEIVIGLVYAAGTDVEPAATALSRALKEIGYREEMIRLSKLLEDTPLPEGPKLVEAPFDEYISSRMEAGNYWRETTKRGDAMALLGIARIRSLRQNHYGGVENSKKQPVPNCAFIIRSLKHKDEVATLREVYGPSFFLISLYEPKRHRIDHLARQIASSHHIMQIDQFEGMATSLINRDDREDDNRFGQQVRETFWQGDAFINIGSAELLDKQIRRIIQMWFGYPFHTPTRDEYAMFFAQAAAYRSASMGRQVGAAIARPDGSILATGANEVPKAGGGTYWSDDLSDRRDHILGYDSSDVMRRDLLTDMVQRLIKDGWFAEDKKVLPVDRIVSALLDRDPRIADLTPAMEGALFMNLTEFQRPVHAEMTALTDAVRHGLSVFGCTLYVTTFPCHGCTRHIIAAGIKRVVYIEPYIKSLARNLHADEIYLDDLTCNNDLVRFETFVGLAPRRYMDFFEMTKRKETGGAALNWLPLEAYPRLKGWHHTLTVENEGRVLAQAQQWLQHAGIVVG
jgi:deoxycytidylate deaminase